MYIELPNLRSRAPNLREQALTLHKSMLASVICSKDQSSIGLGEGLGLGEVRVGKRTNDLGM